ncbi:4-coumarate--CoA ligase-like 7 [Brachypodium distachyon]|uniref:4-coumarate--CoA ligase-like 7 n=1 Tax=Brachypodium distachyon TaxID=15368 RepID=UPI00052FDCD5|nr:4-coumarate--CoA ligase-like 7 [Brachypodium distachyon]|eukprot:XP_010229672.1 4-coumarate--CoA ligase-like 7 [Brachypodium distachyon]
MGFFFTLNGIAMGQTTVVMTESAVRAGLRGVLDVAERSGITEIMAAAPVVVGMTREMRQHWRLLPALEHAICGGAQLPDSAAKQFRRRFLHLDLCMVSTSSTVSSL